ncbi:MAG: DUF115 domain-containing protein [Spirochaetales bacterium]|jgi:hypothetical protein|nr:DUF115 domain-containing protein [Spirochaetales bacterium]
MNQAIFERNILSLRRSDPGLAARLVRAAAAANAGFTLSKTQKTVMVLDTGEGRRALHSLFDPEKEGQRLLAACARDGFLLFLGFGCAYHILPCLTRPEISRIVILDRDIGLLKAALGEIDLRPLFIDPRVCFLVDPAPEELRSFVLSNYFPALAGDLRTVALRPRVEMEKDFFHGCMQIIRESLDALSGDFTTQNRFGKKWFLNTLSNLEAAGKSFAALIPKRGAIVTGAGPSLEYAIAGIKNSRKENLLIATDTSLPVLLQHDLCPDAVISMDCQHISYNHFLAGYPEGVPLVLDLASPPVIARLTQKLIFFTSGNPFSQYLAGRWRQFPFIDTSGGNVSYAAVCLADSLGAQEIFLYGADFSYPEGKSYAREAYIYPFFRGRESRVESIESLFAHFLFRGPVSAVWENGCVRYTGAGMLHYRERLENLCGALRARLVPCPGKGEPIVMKNPARENPPRPRGGGALRSFAAESGKGSWREFLAAYRESLRALPPPHKPVMSYLHGLSKEEKDVWTTLLPVTAACFRPPAEKPDAPELLELARSWALKTIERFL